MKSLNVNIYKIQMSYFFSAQTTIRAFELISSLYAQLKDVFRTEPQTLPLPEEVPSDVPRCIWNDTNTNLTFNKVRLDFSFNIPQKFSWEELFSSFNVKIIKAIEECKVAIDRVGLVTELASSDSIHDKLSESVQIEEFRCAKEANISWLESVEVFNVWTYFSINELLGENKIVFDINSKPEFKLAEQGILGLDAMCKCGSILKGRMTHVL